MTVQASHPAVAALLARLVGPLSLVTQDAVRRWDLAIDSSLQAGAEETLAEDQAQAPVGGATLRGPGVGSVIANASTGSAQSAAEQLRAVAPAVAPIPLSGAAGLDVVAGPGPGVESTAAELKVAGTGSADFSAMFRVSAPDPGDGESGATVGRRLPRTPTPPHDFPTTPGSALFGIGSASRRDGETNVAATPQIASGVAAAVPSFVADFAPGPLRAIGEWPAAAAAAANPSQPAPPPAPAATAVDFRPGTVLPPKPIRTMSAPAPTSVVGVAAEQGPQHPSELGASPSEVGLVVAPQLDLVATATLQSPLRVDGHRAAAASSATGSDREPVAAAPGTASVDVVAAPVPAAATSMRLSPGASPLLAASAAGLPPTPMIRLRPAPPTLPINDGSGTLRVQGPPGNLAASSAAAGESGLGTASAAPSAAALTAWPDYRAVAARLDRALAPVFARALAASGGNFDVGEQALTADPTGQAQGPAPTQVSNTFNVKVALGGKAGAADLRQIEDAVADWLRDSARRQGLIG